MQRHLIIQQTSKCVTLTFRNYICNYWFSTWSRNARISFKFMLKQTIPICKNVSTEQFICTYPGDNT